MIIDEAKHSRDVEDDNEVTEITQEDVDMIDDAFVEEDVSFYREIDNVAAPDEATEITEYYDEDVPFKDDVFNNIDDIPEERDEQSSDEEDISFKNNKTEKKF